MSPLFIFTIVVTFLQHIAVGEFVSFNRKTEEWGVQVDSIKNSGFSFSESHLDSPVGTVLAYAIN